MTERSVASKLLIKPGQTVRLIGADAAQSALLGPLPDGATATGSGTTADVALLFARDRGRLDELLPQLEPFRASTVVWLCYPKGNTTDLNRDVIRVHVETLGWEAVGIVALDQAWSALRVKNLR